MFQFFVYMLYFISLNHFCFVINCCASPLFLLLSFLSPLFQLCQNCLYRNFVTLGCQFFCLYSQILYTDQIHDNLRAKWSWKSRCVRNFRVHHHTKRFNHPRGCYACQPPVICFHISLLSKLSRAILTMANTLNTASKHTIYFAGDNRATIR